MSAFDWIAFHGPMLVAMVPLAGTLAVALLALRRAWLAHALATAAASGAAFVSGVLLWRAVVDGPVSYQLGGWAPPLGIELVVDKLSGFFAAVVSTMAATSLWWSRTVVSRELAGREGTFYATALLVLAGLMGMLVTGDVFNFYVCLEVASLSGYALVAAAGGPGAAAAFRYLLLGTLGASFYLLGVGYLYVATGTLNMADLAPRLVGQPLATVAAAFVALGLAIKVGLFPFHSWMPDAYARGPWASAAFVAPIMTKVMVYGIARFTLSIFGDPGELAPAALGPVLTWAGAIAVVVGASFACLMTGYRRLLAWSSVSQMGYIVLGLGLAHPLALAGALLHVLNHAMMKGALFWAGGAHGAERLADMRGMGVRAPWTTACLVIAGLSLVGVPPFGGFFSKWYLLRGALAQDEVALAGVLLLGSLLAVIYVFRVIEAVCFGGHGERAPEPWSMRAPLVLVAGGILAVGLLSPWIVQAVLWRPLP